MRLRTLLLAALLVGGFVYITSNSDSPLRRVLPGSNAPLWSDPIVAHSAGLGSDEQNNIDIYKSSQDAWSTSPARSIKRRSSFSRCR